MNAAPCLRWVFVLGVILAVMGFSGPSSGNRSWGGKALWAQEEKTPASVPAEGETTPSQESSVELPHTKFLLDYVMVLVLIAVALYAVCRSSRRV